MPLSSHLAAAVLLTASTGAASAQVQSEAPAQLHSPTLNPHHKSRTPDFSWLWPYTEPTPDGREDALVHDPSFQPFLRRFLTAPQSFWKKSETLPNVALDFLGVPGQVVADANRYLSISGCVPHFCPSRGLLWVDTGLPEPLVVFAAIDWISDNRATTEKDAAYTLWLFPSRSLGAAQLPAALIRTLTRWTGQPSSGATELQNITRVYLVETDGTPHTLAPATAGAHNALPAETADEGRPKS